MFGSPAPCDFSHSNLSAWVKTGRLWWTQVSISQMEHSFYNYTNHHYCLSKKSGWKQSRTWSQWQHISALPYLNIITRCAICTIWHNKCTFNYRQMATGSYLHTPGLHWCWIKTGPGVRVHTVQTHQGQLGDQPSGSSYEQPVSFSNNEQMARQPRSRCCM